MDGGAVLAPNGEVGDESPTACRFQGSKQLEAFGSSAVCAFCMLAIKVAMQSSIMSFTKLKGLLAYPTPVRHQLASNVVRDAAGACREHAHTSGDVAATGDGGTTDWLPT